MNNGTGAGVNTFWRGAGTWAVPPGGGGGGVPDQYPMPQNYAHNSEFLYYLDDHLDVEFDSSGTAWSEHCFRWYGQAGASGIHTIISGVANDPGVVIERTDGLDTDEFYLVQVFDTADSTKFHDRYMNLSVVAKISTGCLIEDFTLSFIVGEGLDEVFAAGNASGWFGAVEDISANEVGSLPDTGYTAIVHQLYIRETIRK